MAPKISDTSDLLALIEEFGSDNGVPKFIRTVFVALDEDDIAYWGAKEGVRKYFISNEEYEAALKPIPDDWVFPELTADLAKQITIAPNDGVGEGLFIKRPKLSAYDPEEVGKYLPSAPRMLLEEIHILETLSKNPHPNIVRYHGVRVRRGRITGIVLDRHDTVLDALENENEKALMASLDRNKIMTGLESAVAHLHSLGLAHNDLNPSNVLIGKDKEAILTDFGSCQPFGNMLVSLGTEGWIDEDFTTSEKKHDLAALPKIKAWLDNVYEGNSTGLPSLPLDGLSKEFIESRGLDKPKC
jgi:serine/threonine protein kinase